MATEVDEAGLCFVGADRGVIVGAAFLSSVGCGAIMVSSVKSEVGGISGFCVNIGEKSVVEMTLFIGWFRISDLGNPSSERRSSWTDRGRPQRRWGGEDRAGKGHAPRKRQNFEVKQRTRTKVVVDLDVHVTQGLTHLSETLWGIMTGSIERVNKVVAVARRAWGSNPMHVEPNRRMRKMLNSRL